MSNITLEDLEDLLDEVGVTENQKVSSLLDAVAELEEEEEEEES